MVLNNKKLQSNRDSVCVPFFSIIIPVYNVAPYLRECLDSVLAQTYSNWECLCVDDGSTDESGAILDEYAQKESRFRVFHKVNGGVSAARNLALDNVKGEWVCFLDGDDLWRSDLLQECINNSLAYSLIDVFQFDFYKFPENKPPFWPKTRECNAQPVDITTKLTRKELGDAFWGNFYKWSVVKGIRFQSCVVGEDLLYLTECMLRARQTLPLNFVGYGYRQRLNSVTHQKTSPRVQYSRLCYVPAILNLYNESSKQVDAQCWNQYLTKITDSFVRTQFLLTQEERSSIWSAWRLSLHHLSQLKKIPLLWRIKLRLLCIDSYLIIFMFSVLPYSLRSFLYRRIRVPLQRVRESLLNQ